VPGFDYIRVFHGEPHAGRGRELLAAHPELRALAGHNPMSAVWTVALVAAQIGLALLVGDRRWFVWLPCAYIAGATIDHALWVLIHECSHNLIFRRRTANRLVAIVANLPMVVPGAISFAKYHLLHHRHLGELDYDCGIPGPLEARTVARSSLAKASWVAGYAVVQGVRPSRLKKVRLLDAWTVANMIVEFAAMGALVYWTGSGPIGYLLASTVFAIGLHPLGGRWIQEHFALAPDQETYSYYGPLNKVAFNAGYHVEHHDLITVPWSRLPEIRRTAPEFYDSLHSYQSWTALLVRFIVDRHLTLFNYVVRPSRDERDSNVSV
jgi:sphingolipid 4-desaturase/C4-monooxygenase